MAEVGQYAELVKLGEPDFIEIKGVTFCGSSPASKLSMKNVPYHRDVREFGEVRLLRSTAWRYVGLWRSCASQQQSAM